MADVDWQRIRLDYVRGKGTYKALAEKYGVSLDTLEKRAKREKWYDARRAYSGKVAAKAEARAQARDVKRLAALQNAGTAMCAQLEALMRDAQRELHTHVGMVGEVVVDEAINDRKMLNITKSIETMSRAMRNLYDIQTAAERAQLAMAREEMALKAREQQRRENETQAKAEDKKVSDIRITYDTTANPEAYHE